MNFEFSDSLKSPDPVSAKAFINIENVSLMYYNVYRSLQ